YGPFWDRAAILSWHRCARKPRKLCGFPGRSASCPLEVRISPPPLAGSRTYGGAPKGFRQRRDRCQMAEGLARILDRLGLERHAKDATKVTAQIEALHAAAAQTPAPEALS